MSVQLKSWFFSNVRGLNSRGKYINFNDESEPDTITFQALLDTSVLKRASTDEGDYQDQASHTEINNRTIDRFVTSNQLPSYAINTDVDGVIFTVTKNDATTDDNTINAGNEYILSYNRPTITDLTDRTMTNLVSARNLPQTSYNVNGAPITGQSVDYITVTNSTLGTGTYGRFLSYNIQVKPLTTDYISYAGALLTDTIAGINTSLGNYVTTTAFNASQAAQDSVIATKLTGLSITAGTGTKITVNANGLVTGYTNAADSDITNTSTASGTKVSDALSWLKGVTDSLTTSVAGKQNSSANLTSLSGLTYVSSALVRMSGINTFTLDTNTYLQSGTLTTNYILKYNGTNAVNSLIFDNGTNIGVGTATPNTYSLVDFNSSTLPIKIPVIITANQPSASNITKGGFMYNDTVGLVQYSNGVAWFNLLTNSGLTTNYNIKYNGTQLTNSLISDDGTHLYTQFGASGGSYYFRNSDGSDAIQFATNGVASDNPQIIARGNAASFQLLKRDGTKILDTYLSSSGNNCIIAGNANNLTIFNSKNKLVGLYLEDSPGWLWMRGGDAGTFVFNTAASVQTAYLSNAGLIIGSGVKNTNAMLQADSTSKGFLPPRLTTAERNAVNWNSTTDKGMIIFNTTDGRHQGWDGTTWNNLY